jgi:microsomal dipeptidase-like Zn-dependent dipeptidase
MYNDHIIIDGLQYCHWDRPYFKRLQASGITAVHATMVYHEDARQTLTRFGEWNRLFEQHADLIMPVRSVEDIKIAKATHKVGIFLGAQNCSPIDDEIDLIAVMRQQGLLIMQLTYNNQSLLATGCYEQEDNGVTRFGKQAIAEMNRVGMIIDMSHSAERSTLEAIELSSRPICISHANPSFAHSARRNKSNQVIRSLAQRDMDYGEGCSNNAGWPANLPWFNDQHGMENIYQGLLKHGFNDTETAQILGGNWFNFLQQGLTPTTS